MEKYRTGIQKETADLQECDTTACWMCDHQQYTWLTHDGRRVRCLAFQNKYTYVTVPRESHAEHHLLVVLKAHRGQHKKGLIDCTESDLKNLSKMVSYCCSILKQPRFKYDTVYAGCYSDERHVHFHLIPFNHDRDKGYHGEAMKWLASKELKSAANPFCKMSNEEKHKRLDKIRKIVSEMRTAESKSLVRHINLRGRK